MNQIVVARFKENLDWIDGLSCVVYDKSDQPTNYIKLPNFGREAQTYLHHIITNYDNLAETTIFTQGDPFPHCKDFISRISHKFDKYTTLTDLLVYCRQDGSPDHSGLPLKLFYERLFNTPAPDTFYFGAGAIFAVTKAEITTKPKSFYQKCQWMMFEHIESPWAFERLWPYIFTSSPSVC